MIPISGCLLFSLLYVTATRLYPGGNYLNRAERGFSWSQNYWCNLLNETALNGQANTARPVAFAAMAILAPTLIFFWYQFPREGKLGKPWIYITQGSGVAAMGVSLLVFTRFHDAVLNIAGAFGLLALAGTLLTLRKLGWNNLFFLGILIIVLIGLNNLFYYRSDLICFLPVVQKITFFFFLLWISLINLRWLRELGSKSGR